MGRTTSRSRRRSAPACRIPRWWPSRTSSPTLQIWQLVAYLKTQAANLKEKPVYVPDPDGQVIKSEKQTFKIEILARNLETPWGIAFLPDGRLLITERPGRLRIWAKGQLQPEPVKGTPTVWERQDGGLFDVEVHPNYAQNGWIYLSYAEPGPNNTAPPSMAAAAAAGLLPQRGGGGGGGWCSGAAPARRPGLPRRVAPRVWRLARRPAARDPIRRRRVAPAPANAPAVNTSNTVIVRGKINAKEEWVEQQVIYRVQAGALHRGQRPLRLALHLRPRRPSVLHARRARPDDERAGSVEPARQDPPRQRRRLDPEGQPVRRQGRTRSRRSGATATATRRGWRGIRSAASCGSPSTDRPAVTRSTSSSRATTTAGA